MIELEVLESPDEDILGLHQFFLPEISIGRSRFAQISLRDPDWPFKGLILTSTPQGLLLKNTENSPYIVNGKKITGQKILFQGGEVSIGKTSLKLVRYAPETLVSPLQIDFTKNPFENSQAEVGEELLKRLEAELLLVEYE